MAGVEPVTIGVFYGPRTARDGSVDQYRGNFVRWLVNRRAQQHSPAKNHTTLYKLLYFFDNIDRAPANRRRMIFRVCAPASTLVSTTIENRSAISLIDIRFPHLREPCRTGCALAQGRVFLCRRRGLPLLSGDPFRHAARGVRLSDWHLPACPLAICPIST